MFATSLRRLAKVGLTVAAVAALTLGGSSAAEARKSSTEWGKSTEWGSSSSSTGGYSSDRSTEWG